MNKKQLQEESEDANQKINNDLLNRFKKIQSVTLDFFVY